LPSRSSRASEGWIEIRNAREHNLKGIDVAIPRDAFTVITGVLRQWQNQRSRSTSCSTKVSGVT